MNPSLQALYYFFLAQPGVVAGMLDFFILAPLFQQLERQWRSTDLTLRERLGGGNFGEVYEGIINQQQGARPSRNKAQSLCAVLVYLNILHMMSAELGSGVISKAIARAKCNAHIRSELRLCAIL